MKNLQRILRLILCPLAILGAIGCSTLQPPDSNGPRANLPAYPVVTMDEASTREDATLAWRQLAPRYGIADKSEVVLEPLTATIKSLPPNLATNIFLPKVGATATQTEEEMRESLRRFIDEWRSLIGADPSQLSLVDRTDEPSGVKIARYEQRPFRYPLRGGYGNLLIRFTNSRQVVEIFSNCLRNTERLASALAAITPVVSAEEAATHVQGKTVTTKHLAGRLQTISLSPTEAATTTQMVVYVLPSSDQSTLELHLAWEIETPNAQAKRIYLDAVSDQIIAAE